MKKLIVLLIAVTAVLTSFAFQDYSDKSASKIEIFMNDVPFVTEKYTRIGYTLKMWEWKNEGLILMKVVVLDNNSKAELFTIEKDDLPPIYTDPLPSSKDITFDKIDAYYMSIQLPIPINNPLPSDVSHKFFMKDTVNNKELIVEGGTFSPRKDEKPLVISSPVKGNDYIFMNQSTLQYHFFTLFFMHGKVGYGERYASDIVQINENNEFSKGDPKMNSSYFCYGNSLYAVGDGVVYHVLEGQKENKGDAQDVTFNNIEEYAGNHIILKLDNGFYAVYAHCIPGSILFKKGERVKEGMPIALLGNSGNSTMPHLHFSVNDGPDFLMSASIPFVIKEYTKIREYLNPDFKDSITVTNSMMEETSIVNIK
ncbi:MAG: M23 family metallopeptidase [Ignavibacteria bacterium]